MAKTPDHMSGIDKIGRTTVKPSTALAVQGHNSQPHKHHKKMRIRHATFDSTCLQSAEYSPADETVTVTFTDGTDFDYDCSPDEWAELKATQSEGDTGATFNFIFKGTK